MAIAKKLNIGNIFLFLFLVLFPFGQILRIGIVQPIDVVVGLASIYTIISKLPRPKVFVYFENFLLVAGFSWILSIFLFKQVNFYGLLYLVRVAAYFYFFVYAWNFAKKGRKNADLLINSIVGVASASAIFGWIQYFLFPSIKAFSVWGWDEHLYRLVGTFLDPTYLGIILVIGFILALKKSKLISLFLLISIAFTYARAVYLAFGAGLVVYAFLEKKVKLSLFFLISFLAILLLLPKNIGGLGVNLARTNTFVGRLTNYKETLQIFSKSPVFGIGYDNLCLARNKYINLEPVSSHSCSGSDSSILFILTTTGVLGLIYFTYMIKKIGENSKPLLIVLGASLFVHSLFANSLFYPWVLGLVMIVLALTLRREGNG